MTNENENENENTKKTETLSPCELARWVVERRGYPSGIGYEALTNTIKASTKGRAKWLDFGEGFGVERVILARLVRLMGPGKVRQSSVIWTMGRLLGPHSQYGSRVESGPSLFVSWTRKGGGQGWIRFHLVQIPSGESRNRLGVEPRLAPGRRRAVDASLASEIRVEKYRKA